MPKFGTSLSRLLYAILLLGLALVGIGILAAVTVGVMSIVDPGAMNSSLSVDGRAMRLGEPGVALSVAALIGFTCVYGGAVIVQLLGLLRSAARGAPFVQANVRRLRVLAALFGTMLLVRTATFALPDPIQDVIDMREGHLDLGTLFAALFALVLAEVFREGVRLREDAEGTI